MTEEPVHPLDLRELLAALQRNEVDYTVIGGVAVQVHGHRRTTMDPDVIPAPATANLERLARTLAELGAHPRDLPGGAPAPCSSTSTASRWRSPPSTTSSR